MTGHLRIVGDRRDDRLRAIAAHTGKALVVRCHQRLRGPYTGVDTVLRAVLPEAYRRWPDLVEDHRVALLYGMPELAHLIGPPPRTLADDAPYEERTRFFGAGWVRCMSQGIVGFLLEYARRIHGDTAFEIAFEEAHAAEATTQELIALLLRRADPRRLRVVVSATGGTLSDELQDALADVTLLPAPRTAEQPVEDRTPRDWAVVYVDGDCTDDDPRALSGYQRTDPQTCARLHDRRADSLEQTATWGIRMGAIAHHREHGSDPAGAGRAALLAAQRHAVATGFSAAVVDLGLRGRGLTDPRSHEHDYWEFTREAAAACIPVGRLEQSMELYQSLLRRFTDPKIHMMTSYAIAMLHTRFLKPRDHELAVQWQHNAVALAGILPDPAERLTYSVFHDNGLALVEMHRGNLHRALALVESCITRLDERLDDDQWALHRSQLLYNRARLLVALGRPDEAHADYTRLVDIDPYYTDYLSERARISRDRGDFDAALADYDRAVRLAPPFPELYYNRGTARAQVGDHRGALRDFTLVLEMEPRDLDTRIARAELLLETGDLDAAEADTATGLGLHPGELQLLCLKGTVLLQRDQLDGARAAFDGALEKDPRYPAALINRAVVHFRQSHPERAVADLTAALEAVGDDPDILLNRGIAHLADGHPDLALEDFDQALTLPDADTVELQEQRRLCTASSAR
ncbi:MULTISPECIES: tetratricopeptide repeat protein [unclassified Streptomyces]|uniref:tetratricopeptide repeat protein n=1 Tax=unclassified Streptomyces TaxID=2593676 RepID=UPI0033AD9E13|nr:tetratricopeptide repeat protein [Streptomyces sp. NBC_01176]